MIKEQCFCFEMMESDISCAKKAYNSWEDSQNESPIEIIARKRSADLAYLLEDVIKNELTPTEQRIVEMFYFQNYQMSHIAKVLNINRSTAARRLDTAHEKIYRNLKYAVKYQYDTDDEHIVPLAVREALSLCAVRAGAPHCIGGRILRLRTLAGIDLPKLASCTGIPENSLLKIETGKSDITAKQAICIAAFFKVSTDYLLTGKELQQKS